MKARIECEQERLRQFLIADCQNNLIFARNSEQSLCLLARGIACDGVARDRVFDIIDCIPVVAVLQRGRWIVVQVPNETIESRIFRNACERSEPVIRNVLERFVGRRRLARKTADQCALRH